MPVNSNPCREREPWGWASPVHRDLFPAWYAEHRDDGEGRRIRWADHQDVQHVAGGRVRYICHPYQLHGEALADFEKLRALGWRVEVYGESDYHEHALMVVIERKPARG